ncbi:MAG: glutamate mutase L, partial [Tenericutes bacterium]|nr:glutamate mutase L [Mycoplasmatota bacterium]
MANYLLIDFGSTFTKLCAVNSEAEDVIETASHFTTVDSDISIGYHKALESLYEKIGKTIEFDQVIACSSAAGGLKMAAIGLVEELTVEAAKRVCLGAGARVDLVLSHHINISEVKKIDSKKIDIILLAGGADGGNSECVIYNAEMLGKMGVKIPVIFAGNKSAQDEIQEIFAKYNMDGHICDNVMPKINALNIESAREKIRDIFLK